MVRETDSSSTCSRKCKAHSGNCGHSGLSTYSCGQSASCTHDGPWPVREWWCSPNPCTDASGGRNGASSSGYSETSVA